jgi:hypothetical protein
LSGSFRIFLQAPQEADLTGVIKVVGSGATDQVQCWRRRGYERRDCCAQTAVFGIEDRDIRFPVDLLRLPDWT